jgi:uncharacterized protein
MTTIGIIGASGFVGTRLAELAIESGHKVVRFSRSSRPGFRPLGESGPIDVSGLDAVVNLAGEPILGIWTEAKKQRILKSRTEGTRRVACSFSTPPSPRILVNASAIGFYGDTGENAVDENSPVGTGFLPSTCKAWESATLSATRIGSRVVCLRIGFVLGRGGAMKLVGPIFRAGLGGKLGSGRQWMSCVHVDDVAGMILWAIENPSISGPVNAVMPEPVRNSEFTRSLAKAFHRPAIFPAPAVFLRLFLGGMSSILLDSAKVLPAVAVRENYKYRYPSLVPALQSLATQK